MSVIVRRAVQSAASWFSVVTLISVLVVSPHIAVSSQASSRPASDVVGTPRIKLRSGDLFFKGGTISSSATINAELSSAATSPSGKDYVLVQFAGPVTEADRAALVECGAQIHEYLPDFAFLVGIGHGSLNRLSRIEGVLGIAPYLPQYRVEPTLLAEKIGSSLSSRRSVLGAGPWLVNAPADALDLTIVGFSGESLAQLVAAIEDIGGSVIGASDNKNRLKVRALVPTNRGVDVANLPAVSWIEATPEWTLSNNVAAGNSVMDVADVRNSHGLYGSGQIAAVADSGLDQGSVVPANLHNDFENGAGASRVLAILDIAGDGDVSDTSGHGTHVTGSVLGNGSRSGSTPSTHTYPDTCFAGMAPEAQLVFQAVMTNSSGAFELPVDLNTMFDQARGYDAWVHSNSWGSRAAGGYNSYSQDIDENVWNNKDFCILVAAANNGIDADRDGLIDPYSMGAPSTAKNCITVGASENYRPTGAGYDSDWGVIWPAKYHAEPIFSDHLSDNANGMAAFSSRGPCMDGRLKPDVIAPGTNIVSVRSSVGGVGWGEYNSYYSYMGGTSMSTPLVAGAAILVRDFFARGNYPGITSPSAALIKATLMNGATDMSPGQYASVLEVPTRPNIAEGWGRVDLEDSLFDTASRKHMFVDNKAGLSTGGEMVYDIEVQSSAVPLSAHLVWSDYPGSLAYGGGLVNDLDLTVTRPDSSIVYPNNASQRGPSRYMSYRDGYDVALLDLNAGKGYAVKFTPSSYPFYLDAALVSQYYTSTDGPDPFTINVYDDNGPGGLPGTLLRATNANSVVVGIIAWPISTVTIPSGSFYIECRGVGARPDLTTTEAAPVTTGNDFYYDGSSWSAFSNDATQDIGIDAIGHTQDYTTNNDRVNNVEGIDIPSPVAGTYRIKVKAYNVPNGPQPYAVVVSGGIGSNPVVTAVTSSLANGIYRIGQVVPIRVLFSENVIYTPGNGMARLMLETGTTDRLIAYSSGSGSSVLIFNYTVQAEDTTPALDYVSSTALTLNGTASIKDAEGNNAVLTLPVPGQPNSLSANKSIEIDGVLPTVESVNRYVPAVEITRLSSVTWRVTFSEPVDASTVSASDFQLTDLSSSLTGESITSTSPTTGGSLTIDVTVDAGTGDGTLRLDVPAAATITDIAGNDYNSNYIVGQTYTFDRTSPTVVSVDRLTPDDKSTNAASVIWRVTFSESINASTVSASDFRLVDVYRTITGEAIVSTSPIVRTTTTIDVTVNTGAGDGTLRLDVIAAATIADLRGNDYNSNFVSGQTYEIDKTVPTVTLNQASAQDDPTKTSPINFTVVFSEVVTGFAGGDVTLTGRAGPTTAIVSGKGDNKTFNVAVSGMTADGGVIARIGAGVAKDAAGNLNTAATSTDNSVTYDSTPPSVTINHPFSQQDPTNQSTVNFVVIFSERVSGFEATDVVVDGTAGGSRTVSVIGSGATYNVAVRGMTSSGTVIARIPAGVAYDAANNDNLASTSTDNVVTFDNLKPRVTITQASGQADPTDLSPVNFTVEFSEPVTGFTWGDVLLSGTACPTGVTVTGGPTTYNIAITGMAHTGTVVADVPSGVARDTAGNGNSASAGGDNVVSMQLALENLSISPSGGTLGTSPTTFSAVYRDTSGYADIKRAYLLINDSLDQSRASLLYYDRSANRVYLKNDANTSWGTGYAPGTGITLENSQCFFHVKDTTTSGSGNDLTVNWRIALKDPFAAKALNSYMYMQNAAGTTRGWDLMGIYYGIKPVAVGINPGDEVLPVDSETALTSLYRDPNGYTDIRKCYLLLCENFSQADAVFLYYDRLANKVYLKDDANTSWGTGYPPGADITLSNSQCEVYLKNVTAVGSGNDLTVTWSFKLKPSMTDRNLYSWMYVTDAAALSDGWKKVGTHFTPAAPICVSVTPASGDVTTGVPAVFTTEYSDENGNSDISQCYLQISPSSSQANAIYVLYDAKQDKVFLRNDANSSWGVGQAPGVSATLENSQCVVYVKDVAVTPSGAGSLMIDWSIALKPSVAGKLLAERMYCRDNEMMNSGWKLMGYIRGQ